MDEVMDEIRVGSFLAGRNGLDMLSWGSGGRLNMGAEFPLDVNLRCNLSLSPAFLGAST